MVRYQTPVPTHSALLKTSTDTMDGKIDIDGDGYMENCYAYADNEAREREGEYACYPRFKRRNASFYSLTGGTEGPQQSDRWTSEITDELPGLSEQSLLPRYAFEKDDFLYAPVSGSGVATLKRARDGTECRRRPQNLVPLRGDVTTLQVLNE